MFGRDLNVDGFIEVILRSLDRTGPIAARVRDGGEIEITTSAGTSSFPVEAANARLRTVCARLATLFGTASPYGGHLRATVKVGDVVASATLNFKNAAGDAWFNLTGAQER
jgi:hypothetical protein